MQQHTGRLRTLLGGVALTSLMGFAIQTLGCAQEIAWRVEPWVPFQRTDSSGKTILFQARQPSSGFLEVRLRDVEIGELLRLIEENDPDVVFVQDTHTKAQIKWVLATPGFAEALRGMGFNRYVIEAAATAEMCTYLRALRCGAEDLSKPPVPLGPMESGASCGPVIIAMHRSGLEIIPGDHPKNSNGCMESGEEREAWITKQIEGVAPRRGKTLALFGSLHGRWMPVTLDGSVPSAAVRVNRGGMKVLSISFF